MGSEQGCSPAPAWLPGAAASTPRRRGLRPICTRCRWAGESPVERVWSFLGSICEDVLEFKQDPEADGELR